MKTSLMVLPMLVFSAAFGSPSNTPPTAAPQSIRFVDDDTPGVIEVRQVGEQAIKRLAFAMVNEVTAALAKDSPEAAVDVCHLKALPVIHGTVAGLPRITAVKLSSLRLRSPANAPDAAERQALELIQRQMENGDAPTPLLVQRIDLPSAAPEWRVYKPLGLLPKCLICHGDPAEQSDALRTKLHTLYPADQASGYVAGAWRGLLRVSVADTPAPRQ